MLITEFSIAEFKPVNRCSQLTCVHPCCHPIQIMWWFIGEAAIVLFVDTPLHSVPCDKWHNLLIAPSQMNLQVVLIEWQKGCKHTYVSRFDYVIWSANVLGNVDYLTACSMTVCMCSILTCDHNDENFSFSFCQCLVLIFLNKNQGIAAKTCDTKPQILINQLKCFEFCKDIGVTISQFLTKDVAFIRET